MPSNILIIAAHPDDEILGCGATVARLAGEGFLVSALILGCGKSSRADRTEDEIKREQEILRKETEASAVKAGITRHYFLDFPDQKYDSVPLLEIIQAIEKVKKEVQPEIVFTHHRNDLNLDHRITFQAALTAFRPQPGEATKSIYSFEIPSSTEWTAGRENFFTPDVYFDVTSSFDKKLEAMRVYESELRDFPHPRSIKYLSILAEMRGAAIGREKAEAFELIREIK